MKLGKVVDLYVSAGISTGKPFGFEVHHTTEAVIDGESGSNKQRTTWSWHAALELACDYTDLSSDRYNYIALRKKTQFSIWYKIAMVSGRLNPQWCNLRT